MNFYKLFYWFTVSDKVRGFFDVFSNIFTTAAIISLCVYIILSLAIFHIENKDEKESVKYWHTHFRRFTLVTTLLMVITWAGYIFTPTKKELVMIIAGGAVGNFITQDSTARQIPHDVMVFLQTEIRTASAEAKLELMPEVNAKVDSLKNMSKEDLIKRVLDNEK